MRYNVKIENKFQKIEFSPEEMMRRKEAYYMLLAALNSVRYCIAEINTRTLNHEHKKMFVDMHKQTTFFLNNIFSKASKKEDIEIIQDISFNNVATITTVFGLIANMPQNVLDSFAEEVAELAVKKYSDAKSND
jgi:hypothetical protein